MENEHISQTPSDGLWNPADYISQNNGIVGNTFKRQWDRIPEAAQQYIQNEITKRKKSGYPVTKDFLQLLQYQVRANPDWAFEGQHTFDISGYLATDKGMAKRISKQTGAQKNFEHEGQDLNKEETTPKPETPVPQPAKEPAQSAKEPEPKEEIKLDKNGNPIDPRLIFTGKEDYTDPYNVKREQPKTNAKPKVSNEPLDLTNVPQKETDFTVGKATGIKEKEPVTSQGPAVKVDLSTAVSNATMPKQDTGPKLRTDAELSKAELKEVRWLTILYNRAQKQRDFAAKQYDNAKSAKNPTKRQAMLDMYQKSRDDEAKRMEELQKDINHIRQYGFEGYTRRKW